MKLVVLLLACTSVVFVALAQEASPQKSVKESSDEFTSLLETAQMQMQAATGFHVEAVVFHGSNTIRLSGDISGDDFDIQLPALMRLKRAKNLYWISRDAGVNWKPTGIDTAIYALLISGLSAVPENWRIATVRAEKGAEGVTTVLQLRSDIAPPEDYPEGADTVEFYVRETNGNPWIARFKGAARFAGAVVMVDTTYSNLNGTLKIESPEP